MSNYKDQLLAKKIPTIFSIVTLEEKVYN